MIREFCAYTLKEVDLRTEAENAPRPFRRQLQGQGRNLLPGRSTDEFTTESLLVMEFLPGLPPNNPAVQALSPEERDRIIDIGAARPSFACSTVMASFTPTFILEISWFYQGPRRDSSISEWSADSTMTCDVLFSTTTTALVMGDAANAARYLASIAESGRKGDRKGFRRDVEEICRRWQRDSTFDGFSIAQLIMESVGRAAKYRMYLPVEMVLMVKAMVTFEAVGTSPEARLRCRPKSRSPYITRIFINQFSPVRIAEETMRGAP